MEITVSPHQRTLLMPNPKQASPYLFLLASISLLKEDIFTLLLSPSFIVGLVFSGGCFSCAKYFWIKFGSLPKLSSTLLVDGLSYLGYGSPALTCSLWMLLWGTFSFLHLFLLLHNYTLLQLQSWKSSIFPGSNTAHVMPKLPHQHVLKFSSGMVMNESFASGVLIQGDIM